MPITFERHVELLTAAERLLAAVEDLPSKIARERGLVESGAQSGIEGLRNLEALLMPEVMIEELNGIRVLLMQERSKATPKSYREVLRKRRQQARRRARVKSGEAFSPDEDEAL